MQYSKGMNCKLRNLKEVKKLCTVKIDNLGAEMKRKKVSRLEIATYLGVSYRTIHSRFNGKVPWEYSECVRIRDHFFPRTHIRIPVRNRGREGGERERTK